MIRGEYLFLVLEGDSEGRRVRTQSSMSRIIARFTEKSRLKYLTWNQTVACCRSGYVMSRDSDSWRHLAGIGRAKARPCKRLREISKQLYTDRAERRDFSLRRPATSQEAKWGRKSWPAPLEMTCVDGLSGRGIGDFTENGGTARASGAGEIAGALVKGLVGEQGEGEGFLGVAQDAKFGRCEDFDWQRR